MTPGKAWPKSFRNLISKILESLRALLVSDTHQTGSILDRNQVNPLHLGARDYFQKTNQTNQIFTLSANNSLFPGETAR